MGELLINSWINRRTALKMAASSAAVFALPSCALANHEQSLSQIARSRGLRFGCAISRRVLQDDQYGRLVLANCDTFVGENAFKWRHLEPKERAYQADEAQWIARYTAENQRDLRGHCFVWNHHDRMPRWLVDLAARLSLDQSEDFTRHMWRHGSYLARMFPDIQSWDAMNEAIDPTTGVLRETHFSRLLGNRFFDLAFRILGKKLPSARLVYNETMSWEANGRHRDGVLRLLERGLSRGLPIHTLGIQSHIGKTIARDRDEPAWRRFLEEVDGMGVSVALTEFDCSDRNIIQRDKQTRDAEVAAHCKGYLDLTLNFTNVREVILWSLADKHSYMNRNGYPKRRRRSDGLPLRGHPYDEGLRTKPMMTAIQSAIKEAPLR